jgi:hypothetical protein
MSPVESLLAFAIAALAAWRRGPVFAYGMAGFAAVSAMIETAGSGLTNDAVWGWLVAIGLCVVGYERGNRSRASG